MSARVLLVLTLTLLPSTLLSGRHGAKAMETIGVRVDPKDIANPEPGPLGINVNYLMDGAHLAPADGRPLAAALREMGARFLRFPGGDKSDSHLWSVAPYAKPAPHAAVAGDWDWPAMEPRWFGEDRRTPAPHLLDFDAFLQVCCDAPAEPVVVLPYDTIHQPADEHHERLSRDVLFESAAAWVRYAKDREPRVRWWEIGNESYFCEYVTAEAYARDLVELARALKQIDPQIRIGANGPLGTDDVGNADKQAGRKMPWWQTVLSIAGDEIDFLSLHPYPCYRWMKYDAYFAEARVFGGSTDGAREAVKRWAPQASRSRIQYLLTETNSADWFGHPEQKGWLHVNNLGHALVLFDMLGCYRADPSVAMALVWNTRWVHDKTPPELWDALSSRNELHPTGQALAIWREHGLDIALDGYADAGLVVHASRSADGKRLRVFLLRKSREPAQVTLTMAGRTGEEQAQLWRWSGEGSEDTAPVYAQIEAQPLQNGELRLTLPPVSLTVVGVE